VRDVKVADGILAEELEKIRLRLLREVQESLIITESNLLGAEMKLTEARCRWDALKAQEQYLTEVRWTPRLVRTVVKRCS
jgi:hypothetical protein